MPWSEYAVKAVAAVKDGVYAGEVFGRRSRGGCYWSQVAFVSLFGMKLHGRRSSLVVVAGSCAERRLAEEFQH